MVGGHRYLPLTKVEWTSSHAYPQFRLWRKEVERIIDGPMAGDSDAVKLNTIFIWAGAIAETLVEACKAEDANLKIEKPKDLLDCLAGCLAHTTYFREAREDFYNIKQIPGENTTTFYSRVLELSRMSEFPANSDFLIVDKLIHGCLNSDCKRKLMARGKDVTVKTCLELLRQHEAVDITMKRFNDSCQIAASYSHDPTIGAIHSHKQNDRGKPVVKPKQPHRDPSTIDAHGSCPWCNGDPHARNQCPAKDSQCNFCHKMGHFEKACFKKRRRNDKRQAVVRLSDSESGTEPDTSYNLDAISVSSIKGNAREVLANVILHTRRSATLQGRVDTGAMVTCMPVGMLTAIGVTKHDLAPSRAQLRGVTGTDLQTHGALEVKATCNNRKHQVRILVTELGDELILGLDFCRLFKLVTIADTCILRKVNVQAVHMTEECDVDYSSLRKKWKQYLPLGKKTGDPMMDLKHIFPETFDGSVGLFDGEVNLKLSSDAKSVQLPPRSVPLSVLPKLKKELDQMESDGIIRPCPETTDWVHNIVVVSKKNGDIRICLDPRNLNKYLVRSVHHTASWEDVQHSFKNGQFFSTLDAKSGYWTKKLSSESQLLTAFNTPFKKYCFVRLPFGLSVSSEIFCEQMDKALAGIPGTFPCADDVKVQGSTEERHDLHLLETVAKARAAGIKFNPDKCHIKKQKISYFGRIVSPYGVSPCPKKVNAVLNMSPPNNKQELQSFLGTVNFLATFIPNLAKKTHMMRGLLKKDVHFVWSSDMQQEFNTVTKAIADAVQLIHFDPNKPVTIETDASLKGLGAVLIQNGKPVKFLSKSLTPAESDYSNIERELLAVLFACEKLHVYIFGRPVTINTDHKPLQAIFQKPISLAPARLQRMLLRLRMYDLQVKYVGAKSVLLADTLSRLVRPGSDNPIPGLDVSIAQVLKLGSTYLESLQAETRADNCLCQLADYIMSGWPEHMSDLPEILQPYWCFRDELAILDGLVMKGSRVVVPSALRSNTLARLHDGHQGLNATLQRARRNVYWPGLHNDIAESLMQCEECQQFGNKKAKTSEFQISVTRPMEVVGMDLMDFKGQTFVVTIDYFSGYITCNHIRSETSEAVIKAVNNDFRKLGLPESIITDNGPCFKSAKFAQFCEDLEIHHVTSSPHYHQSNGRAERAIQTVKKIMKKTGNELDITLAIIAYHDTPIDNDIPSPAELFFNRRINTRLGLMYKPTMLSDEQKAKLAAKRSAHLSPSNRPPDEYVPHQNVWFTEDGTTDWRPGYIESKDTTPCSYWIISEDNGRRMRRNIHDIKPRAVRVAPPLSNRPAESYLPDPTPLLNPASCAPFIWGNPSMSSTPPVYPAISSASGAPHIWGNPSTSSTSPVSPATSSTLPASPAMSSPPPISHPVPVPPVPDDTAMSPSHFHTGSASPQQPPETPAVVRPRKTRSGRCPKMRRDPDYVYM